MIDFKTFLNEHYTFKKVKLSTLNEASLTKRDIMNPKHNYLLDFIEIAKNEPIMFGDNLSFISDTTIAACNGQGCAMKDKCHPQKNK